MKILFWLYILVEIALFILIGKLIGVLPTLALILITAIIGFALLRYQKVAFMRQMQQAMQGGAAAFGMFSGSFIMIAGILLILPGFLTDFLGILCLIPKLRMGILNLVMRFKPQGKTCKNGPCDNNKTIEGEFWRDEENNEKAK
jgi:UPF0716 protein FxsA